MNRFAVIWLLFLISISGQTQEVPSTKKQRYTISGYVRDTRGEELIGANVYIEDPSVGTVTNIYGFFSLTLPEGSYQLRCSYIGYQLFEDTLELTGNTRYSILLEEEAQDLEKVVIRSDLHEGKFQKTDVSTHWLQSKTIKEIPSLLGEADLSKAIQMLPGIMAPGEGISGFIVRGGSYDQNLILLDEAPIYNASHLMGFFSVFNNDIVKDVHIYKGEVPAKYGSRLSSLFDIRLKNGNQNNFGGSGGIGTISSKLMLEGPIVKNRGSFLLAGRRSYADIFLPLSSNEEVKDNRIYFYDLNLKANYRVNEKNRIFISGFMGSDVFKYQNTYYLKWGNFTGSLRWNHLFTERLFSNLSLIYSRYQYKLGKTTTLSGVEWNSSITNVGLKYDFSFYANPKNTIRFGMHVNYFSFRPGYIQPADKTSIYIDYEIPPSQALEYALYLSNNQELTEWIDLEYGIRMTLFQNMGKATVYRFDEHYEPIDSVVYGSGTIFNSYFNIDPTLSINIKPGPLSVITTSFSRSHQNLHLISNSTAGTPIDIWIPSSPNIKPQRANQYFLGYTRNALFGVLELSLGGYYKKMYNQIDYKEHADIILNPELEGELRFGWGRSYGFESIVKKDEGKLTGWISYTLSRSEMKIDGVNHNKIFLANYDRLHDFALVSQYRLTNRWTVSLNWVYASGSPVTYPTGRFRYGAIVVPVFTDRNQFRMPAYHRLDIAASLKGKQKPGRRFTGEWSFSIYNVYNRKNAWLIFFKSNEDNPEMTEAYKLYMFPIIPSISYNFRF